MSHLVAVREYATAEEMMAAYRARHRPASPIVDWLAVNPPEPIDEPKAPQPAINLGPIQRREWLEDAPPAAFRRASSRIVLEAVSNATGIGVPALLSRSRQADIAMPRHIACWLMRHLTSLSFPRIGVALGGRDHSTVMNSIMRVDQMRERDSLFAALVDDIGEVIKARVAQ